MKTWFIEVVQDFDGTYYANMMLGGQPVTGLPENVTYNALRTAIRQKTGIEIPKRSDMKFQQSGRKKYAYLDATQERTDCRVTLEELNHGWRPKAGSYPDSGLNFSYPSADASFRKKEEKLQTEQGDTVPTQEELIGGIEGEAGGPVNWMRLKLRPHVGHEIECVTYGDPDDPHDICVECITCGCVLVSAEDFDEEESGK